jgi:hypothetical protein
VWTTATERDLDPGSPLPAARCPHARMPARPHAGLDRPRAGLRIRRTDAMITSHDHEP